MIDSDWFYGQLGQSGRSLRDLARALQMDASAVSRMLRGERKMSAEEQDGIAEYLGMGIEEVAQHRRGTVKGFEERKQDGYHADQSRVTAKSQAVGAGELRDPIFGCMMGTMTIPPDLDLTAPADPEWGKVYDDD